MVNKKLVTKVVTFFKRKRKIVTGVLLIGAIAVVALFLAYSNGTIAKVQSYFYQRNSSIKGAILFEGDDCLYCTKVETFVKNNHVEDTVSFTRLEVFHNFDNANLLADKAQICGLDYQKIGVPFFWDGKKCIVGYIDIIDFFRSKITK